MNRRLQTVFVAALAITLVIALPLLLSACGNKGPLVLPDRPADAPAESPPPPESKPESNAGSASRASAAGRAAAR